MKVLLAGLGGVRSGVVDRALAARGHEQTLASTGEDALAALARAIPLIVVEDALPDMSASEFCRRARATRNGADAVILVIAHQDEQLVPVLDAGATDLYFTSLGPSALETRLLIAERLVTKQVDERARDARFRRLFEPFFTTKEKGKGTGLGLSTVFGIVKQSGGSVSVTSEPKRGTAFKLYFPRSDRPAESGVRVRAAPATHRGSETILVAEDEEQVRNLTCMILRRNGYSVLEAKSGNEALLIAEQHPGRVDLLLTDVVMPQMSGRLLVERLSAARPDMLVLYMSGYADDALLHHGVSHVGTAFIEKPITPTGLLEKLREVLDVPVARSA